MSKQYSKATLILAFFSAIVCLFSQTFVHYPLAIFLRAIPIIFLILLSLETKNSLAKILLLSALIFSVSGDTVRSLPLAFSPQLSIVAFILAQWAYIILFLQNAEFQNKHLALFLLLLASMVSIFYWLYPYLGELKVPVLVYSCWLISMAYCALQVKQPFPILSIGAFLFLFSEFTFAINQFIFAHDKFIAILASYLYYAAQFLLVLGLLEIFRVNEHSESPSKSQ